jgi:hypothetical protein
VKPGRLRPAAEAEADLLAMARWYGKRGGCLLAERQDVAAILAAGLD